MGTAVTSEQYLAVTKQFASLFSDLERGDAYPHKRPLLAHYTSIETLERILLNNELWFSNPLFMSDIEEIRFGINEGVHHFLNDETVRRACGTPERASLLFDAFERYHLEFANEHVFDLYVLCLSEHTPSDTDGLLSMWRGYGGNGKGVAIVFDTAKLAALPDSPLVLSQVIYASGESRRSWIVERIQNFAALLKDAALPDAHLYIAAWVMFERLKLFAMFSKHQGFSEEKEWRVVYMKERDTKKMLLPMCQYSIGPRGVEPKLKLKLSPINNVVSDISIDVVTHQIILGPSVSSPLARAAVMRMLENVGRHALKTKVVASKIPFRPRDAGYT